MSKSGPREKPKSGKRFSDSFSVGAREVLQKIDENSPTIILFKGYAKELDKKHDKYERLVKLSRDITIESKRIIFLLHTIDRESKKSIVLSEAETKLGALVLHNWKLVSMELEGEDPYLYQKAFSPGMQEFVEAYTFFNYIKSDSFLAYEDFQERLTYQVDYKIEDKDSTTSSICEISTTLLPIDLILGLADVTGELMRKCINSLGEGNTENCFSTCEIVRHLFSEFLSIGPSGNKELSRKIYVLKQSLLKMELVCYNIHVRGKEIPKYMLADVDQGKNYPEDDEGFFD